MLKRWHVLGKSAAAKTAIALALVLSLVALPLPGSMGWAQGEVEAAPPIREATPPAQLKSSVLPGGVFSYATSTPPGQLKRRGLAGNVTSLATSTVPTITAIFTVGDVQVVINEDTIIHSPFKENLTAEDLDGRRIAILFAKGPANEDGTRTALKIIVIPDKPGRTHSRGVIKAKNGGGGGGFEVVDDNGEVIELSDDAGDGGLEEGDDVVVVTQTVTDFNGDGDADGNRHGKPRKIARGLQKTAKIMERLDRIMDRLTELGDSPKAEKLRARVEKFKARHLERFNDINARFSGDGSQNHGRNNIQRGKGRRLDVGPTDFGPSDDGGDDGKQNRGRNRGRSADFFPLGDDTGDDGDPDGDDDNNRGRGKGRNFNAGRLGGNG